MSQAGAMMREAAARLIVDAARVDAAADGRLAEHVYANRVCVPAGASETALRFNELTVSTAAERCMFTVADEDGIIGTGYLSAKDLDQLIDFLVALRAREG